MHVRRGRIGGGMIVKAFDVDVKLFVAEDV